MAIKQYSKRGYTNKKLPKLKESALSVKSYPYEVLFYEISNTDVAEGSRVLETVPADYFIKSITFLVETPFNEDAQVSVSIGDVEALPSGTISLTMLDPQETPINKYYSAAQDVTLNFTGEYTQGNAKVIIERQRRT